MGRSGVFPANGTTGLDYGTYLAWIAAGGVAPRDPDRPGGPEASRQEACAMMTSAMISKVEKSDRYAHEPDRFTFDSLHLEIRGDNDTHRVSLEGGRWQCGCPFFMSHGSCVHVLSVQKLLGRMLPEQAQVSLFEVLEAEIGREPVKMAHA